MNILIVGAGGREHAIGWKAAQSPKCTALFFAPGNAGTSQIGTNLPIKETNFEELVAAVGKHHIDMLVVGPEAPLVEGIHSYFQEHSPQTLLIAPSAQGARLEGSKDWSKQFMQRHNIPTGSAKTFTKNTLEEGIDHLDSIEGPFVLKADGLAAGKGVIITNSRDEAKLELDSMLSGKFGEASSSVLVEEFLDGIELSVFVLTDGKDYVVFPEAKDYKRIGEGDTGLNTGGMGAVSPVPFADKAFMDKIEKAIVQPTVKGLTQEGISYRGFIFFGLINVGGEPKVIEYNARLGDPETEAIMLRTNADLVNLFEATAKGELAGHSIKFDDRHAVTVVAVSGGYPETYQKGYEIKGLQDTEGTITFHAGTKKVDGMIITNGGRVLAVSALGATKEEALEKSYASLQKIEFKDKGFRKDIGFDL